MNWLQHAKEAAREVIEYRTEEEYLQFGPTRSREAIAAALIALTEQKPRFVQIGEVAYNLDHIRIVNMIDGLVGLFFEDDDEPCVLNAKEGAAFLSWWNEHADIVRLNTEQS